MNYQRSSIRQKHVGDVFFAFHPLVEQARFLTVSGCPIDLQTSTSMGQRPCKVEMPGKLHPAVIVSPGDAESHGFLVCYFSSHETAAGDSIPRRRILGIEITEGKEVYIFQMAPMYCHNVFFTPTRLRRFAPLEMNLIYGHLLHATQTHADGTWDAVDPNMDALRCLLRQVVHAWTHPDDRENRNLNVGQEPTRAPRERETGFAKAFDRALV